MHKILKYIGIKSNKIIQASAIMGVWAIYGPHTIFIYLLTYYFRFWSGTRVPLYYPTGTRVIHYPDTAALYTGI